MRIKVAVQSIDGGVAKSVDLLLGSEEDRGSWTVGPYEATVPYADYAKSELRARHGHRRRGREANDIRMLKGPQTTVESVVVDVVQLHVSAVDKANHFVKGLTKEDFKVAEDGRPQTITGFEVAENLPLDIGLVIDSSGSMEKGMPFVRDACSELFKVLMREKDRGFVVEFRDQPKFLQELTADTGALQRASRDLEAAGRDRALRRRRARPVPVPDPDRAQGVSRRHRRRRQPVPCRFRHASALRALSRRANLLHRGRHSAHRLQSRRSSKRSPRSPGGEVFTIGNASKISEVTHRIEEELRSQYILAYQRDSSKPDCEYRARWNVSDRQAGGDDADDQGLHPSYVACRFATDSVSLAYLGRRKMLNTENRWAARAKALDRPALISFARRSGSRSANLPPSLPVGRLFAPRADAGVEAL